jgi:enterobactin synthetase component D
MHREIKLGELTLYRATLDEIGAFEFASLPEAEKLEAILFTHERRRSEFLAGRYLYHQVTLRPEPLLRKNSLPIWPTDLVGSISHKNGEIAFAYSERAQFQTLGVDIECISDMDLKLESTICNSTERGLMDAFAPFFSRAELLSFMFSAKEALFKSQYPITQQWLDFKDLVVLEIEPEKGMMRFRGDFPPVFFGSEWVKNQQYVLSLAIK